MEFLLPYIDRAPLYNKIDFNVSTSSHPQRLLFTGKPFPFLQCPSNPFSGRLATITDGAFNGFPPPSVLGGTQGLYYVVCAGSIRPGSTGTLDCPVGGTATSFCISETNVGATWNAAQKFGASQHPGIFSGRGVTNTRIAHVTDGTSNTFLMGERRAELCMLGGAWSNNAPGAFVAQKPNSPTLDETTPNSLNNCGFSSMHEGGLHMLLADGAVRFISENIDHRTFSYLGDKADGQVLGEF